MAKAEVVAAGHRELSRGERDHELARGVKWSAGARGGAQLVTWASTLLVARLLSPSDYGIASAAAIYLGLLAVVSEFGLGTAIVSQRELSPRVLAQLGGFASFCGVGAWLFTIAVAPFAATAIGVPELRLVLPVMGFATALSAINALPLGLLQKQLKFQAVAKADLTRAVAGVIVTLLLAFAGFGYWALILGQVAAMAIFSLSLYLATRYSVARPELASIRGSLGISRRVVTSRLAWFAYMNSDAAVIARVLGKDSLGIYSMARTLTAVPAEKLSGVLMAVSTGLFASIQRDNVETRRYFLAIAEAIAFLLFPLTAGLGLVAPEAVVVLLGEQWIATVPIVQILAPVVALRALGPVCSQVLLARLKADIELRYTLASAVIYSIGFVAGVQFGILGVSFSWLLLSAPMSYWLIATVCREIDLPLGALMSALAGPAACTSAMIVVVSLCRSLKDLGSLGSETRLVILAGAGALAYAVAATLLMRSRVLSALRFVSRNRVAVNTP